MHHISHHSWQLIICIHNADKKNHSLHWLTFRPNNIDVFPFVSQIDNIQDIIEVDRLTIIREGTGLLLALAEGFGLRARFFFAVRPKKWPLYDLFSFHRHGPLGRVSLVVAMSVCLSVAMCDFSVPMSFLGLLFALRLHDQIQAYH